MLFTLFFIAINAAFWGILYWAYYYFKKQFTNEN
jgi:hypothetical protein